MIISLTLYSTSYTSPIGLLTLASEGSALTGLWIENQKYFASTAGDAPLVRHDLPLFADAKQWLDAYFNAEMPAISQLPLLPDGTAYRLRVWEELRTIGYGERVSYTEIAKKVANGRRISARAVGGAVARNPISLILPCHRVVGVGGLPTGYAAGLHIKLRLLEFESLYDSPEAKCFWNKS